MKIEAPRPLEGRRLLVAASGSIAAVKTPLLVSALVKAGAEVRCVITPSASRPVSPAEQASLSPRPCWQAPDQWEPSQTRPLHVALAEPALREQSHLVVIKRFQRFRRDRHAGSLKRRSHSASAKTKSCR